MDTFVIVHGFIGTQAIGSHKVFNKRFERSKFRRSEYKFTRTFCNGCGVLPVDGYLYPWNICSVSEFCNEILMMVIREVGFFLNQILHVCIRRAIDIITKYS